MAAAPLQPCQMPWRAAQCITGNPDPRFRCVMAVTLLSRLRCERCRSNCTASENTAPVPFESAYAIWTSWQHSCDRDDQALMQRGDRVGNVTLGPDRRCRGVGNYREWQVF